MQHTREIFNSIYNYFFNQKEETYEVQIRHGGNQWIDEFYEKKEDGRPNYHKKKFMTFHIEKSKTIEDVKKEIKVQCADGTYLDHTGIHLREEVFGPVLSNTCQLYRCDRKNNIIKLFIWIPDW